MSKYRNIWLDNNIKPFYTDNVSKFISKSIIDNKFMFLRFINETLKIEFY